MVTSCEYFILFHFRILFFFVYLPRSYTHINQKKGRIRITFSDWVSNEQEVPGNFCQELKVQALLLPLAYIQSYKYIL